VGLAGVYTLKQIIYSSLYLFSFNDFVINEDAMRKALSLLSSNVFLLFFIELVLACPKPPRAALPRAHGVRE